MEYIVAIIAAAIAGAAAYLLAAKQAKNQLLTLQLEHKTTLDEMAKAHSEELARQSADAQKNLEEAKAAFDEKLEAHTAAQARREADALAEYKTLLQAADESYTALLEKGAEDYQNALDLLRVDVALRLDNPPRQPGEADAGAQNADEGDADKTSPTEFIKDFWDDAKKDAKKTSDNIKGLKKLAGLAKSLQDIFPDNGDNAEK